MACAAIAMYFHQSTKTATPSYTPSQLEPSTHTKLSFNERMWESVHGPHSASPFYADASTQGLRATSGIPSWVSSEVAETPDELDKYHNLLSPYWDGIVVEAQATDHGSFENDIDQVYDTWFRRRVGMEKVVWEELNNDSALGLNERKNFLYKGFKRYMIALQDVKMFSTSRVDD